MIYITFEILKKRKKSATIKKCVSFHHLIIPTKLVNSSHLEGMILISAFDKLLSSHTASGKKEDKCDMKKHVSWFKVDGWLDCDRLMANR